MIPVIGFRRRAAPPPEPPDGPLGAGRYAFVDSLWPADWAEEWPLDERVFGSVPRAAGP